MDAIGGEFFGRSVKKLRAENELLNKELNVAAQMRIEMREEIERLKKEFSDAK